MYLNERTDENERQLICGLKNGSYKAFDSIYQKYAKRLYAYCLQFTKSAEESEEIVQDVFVRLWTNRTGIRQEETLRSLLFIMTKNLLINAYRSRVNHPVYEDYVEYTNALQIDDTHHRLEYHEFMERFRSILDTLPLTQQKVIKLSRLQQLTNKEVAEMLALSEQTVKNQLSLGLKVLKEQLNKVWWMLMLLFAN